MPAIELHKDGKTQVFSVEPQTNRRPAIQRLLDNGWEVAESSREGFGLYMLRSRPPVSPAVKPWVFRKQTVRNPIPCRVWYAIPSANLDNLRRCLKAWQEMGYRTAVLIEADEDWELDVDLILRQRGYEGYPAAVNRLYRAIGEKADIVVTGGDDIYPDPNHMADQLAEQFADRFPDGFGVMQPVGDDFHGTDRICGSPWMGRKFIRTINGGKGPFWPEYAHFFCDEEMFEVCKMLGVLWQRKDLVQYHDHWSRNGGRQKPYHERAQKNWSDAAKLFYRRKAEGFPDHGVK
ncbi:MAG: hypothetical protein HQ546_09295 [Planctomycetes bacterium]|nr:hypothetical protein [Planctomycetota bacterium]